MMSAKTVSTEVPVANPTPLAPNNAGNVASSEGAPSDFQNLLAGVVPPGAGTATVEPSVVNALPLSPLTQLLNLKSQQQAAKLPAAAAVQAVKPAQAGRPAMSPADLLKSLEDSATLLPESTDPATGETDEPTVPDDILISSEWLEVMLPSSVFAPQAGSTNNAAAGASVEGGLDIGGQKAGASLAPVPASLAPQAASAPVIQGAGATFAINREVAGAAAQNTAAAFATAFAAKAETQEGETPTSDSWMNAMGDLSTRRAPDSVPLAEARLPTPVHDARWAEALAHRLVVMARDGESVASLKLVPVDLGPLDIQISVRDGEASVHFGAAHQETRAVLESSLPRLRELLSAQGLQLANASVSHQSAGQNRPERSSSTGAVGAVTEESEATSVKVTSTSLLDIYA